jgi:hypothetical protein
MATINLRCVASIEVPIDDFALGTMQRAHRGFRCRQAAYHLTVRGRAEDHARRRSQGREGASATATVASAGCSSR